jgi:hypothetical protein
MKKVRAIDQQEDNPSPSLHDLSSSAEPQNSDQNTITVSDHPQTSTEDAPVVAALG